METTTISEETKEIFAQIRQEREAQGKFIKLQSGEKKVLQFNPNRVEVVEAEFDEPGKNTKRKKIKSQDSHNPLPNLLQLLFLLVLLA
jgi:hypothetical protein